MTEKIIRYSYFLLFFLTPLFFLSDNSELFEFNKMRLVYGLTVIITTSWFVNMILQKKLLIKRTPLDIPILLFLASQIISTIVSIDIHTSIWGYYSRSNGGLLSIISYILLYYAFVSNYSGREVLQFLKSAIAGGVIVSLYAIPEHFGHSASCLILTGSFGVDCWVQDVQARVFATLGQPNWLAAYLAMLIFPALYFFLSAKSVVQKFFYFFASLAFYLAFTFTFSRGGSLGFLAGLVFFVLLATLRIRHIRPLLDLIGFNLMESEKKKDTTKDVTVSLKTFPLQLAGIAIIGFIVINILFGSALTGDFRLIKNTAEARPGLLGNSLPSGTQLENGGTESGQIRLIVWKGALEIFKAYPLFGSGVETYAYSYYQFRPKEHNFTSEWDFLYNKAHNEYLNYLATTGIVGLFTYLLLICTFLYWSIKKIILLTHREKGIATETIIFIAALVAGYVTYLVQNIFGFSVVIIAVFFFMFPALVFAFTNEAKELSPAFLKSLHPLHFIPGFIYKRNIYRQTALAIVILFGSFFLLRVYQNWEADTYYKRGNDLTDSGYVGEGFNNFVYAIELNQTEPLYRAELGFAAAAVAISRAEQALEKVEEKDATAAAELKSDADDVEQIAVDQTEEALRLSPNNTSIWRTAIRTYYQLSTLDPKYIDKTLETIDKTISLAPTDPKLYFNKALVLATQEKLPEAIKELQTTLELKPNYKEALMSLADFYFENNQKEESIQTLERVLQLDPNDTEAKLKLEQYTST